MRACMRTVVDVRIYTPRCAPRGAKAKWLILSCGHQTHRKYSIPTPKMAFCQACARELAKNYGKD